MEPELILLDVGHGNCAIVLAKEAVAVIDAPRGGLHIDALRERGITHVDAVVVSHADADHMGGVSHLLFDENIHVGTVYVNGDASKTQAEGGLSWQSFAIALADAERRGTTYVRFGVKRGDPIDLPTTDVRLEVLAPTTQLALLAVGGRLKDGQPVTSNSASLVIRVWFRESPIALLTGDIDELGLTELLAESDELSAKVLVFPHHGGHSGGDDEGFAQTLCEATRPEYVIFSFGRDVFDNPQLEIVRGVRATVPNAAIACTQLSRSCSASALDPDHLADLPALGRATGRCCAGSVLFSTVGLVAPLKDQHQGFITSRVPTPLCRRELT